MWRRTPCDTAPTTSKAAMMNMQQAVKMRKRRSKRDLTRAVFRKARYVGAPAVSGLHANTNSNRY
jgi:hypothetical protein